MPKYCRKYTIYNQDTGEEYSTVSDNLEDALHYIINMMGYTLTVEEFLDGEVIIYGGF